MQNIELKAPMKDRFAVEDRLREIGARRMWTRLQKDTFFGTNTGWLKLREVEGCPAELISYRRSDDPSGLKTSDYDVEVLRDAETWKRLLGRVLTVEQIVEKERTLWLYQHTRIHLDRVRDLGEFVELETVVAGIPFEGAHEEATAVMEALQLDPTTAISRPYRDLLPPRK